MHENMIYLEFVEGMCLKYLFIINKYIKNPKFIFIGGFFLYRDCRGRKALWHSIHPS